MTKEISTKSKNIAILTHLSCLLFTFIAPLIVYLVSEDKFVTQNAKEALNFQISLIIYLLISCVLMFVLIGFVLLAGLFVISILFPILAALEAKKGKTYKYPLTITFLS